MRVFKYDVLELIQSIKDRPCLWDKSLEVYKDRTERRSAWEEVFAILDENYKLMTAEEKRVTGEIILRKWTNIRDTFIKTLKTKLGRPRRKYVLYDYLKFLLKVTPTEEDFVIEYTSDDSSAFTSAVKVERNSPKDTNHKKRSKKMNYDDEEPKKFKIDKSDVEYVEVDECNDPRIMNEDEAFFASLLPSVVKYSEDERLEFRIEVLAVMKKIKEKREWSSDV